MSSDPTTIEKELRRLRAASLDEAYLARLDACTDATWTDLNPLETGFEQHLRGFAPARLPQTLMESLETTLAQVPFTEDATIVRFPTRKPESARRQHRAWWGAAAAVALTGAVTALLVPGNRGPGNIAHTSNHPPLTAGPHAPNAGNLVPAAFNRGLTETSDEGVIWQDDASPHRVLKVVYMDRVTYTDPDGRTYQVEQPRVEYIIVPAKTD